MDRNGFQLFTLKACRAPWGDYGHILMQGMAERAPSGDLLLYRTGPFIPPISFPTWMPVVTQAMKEQLEKHQFTGFEFRRVSKRRIVPLDWRSWDLDADEPAVLPESGEPEDYLLKGRHSAETAKELGELWEMYVPSTPGLQKSGGSDFDSERYRGEDICKMCEIGGHIYVSKRFKEWLEATYSDWVSLQRAKAAQS